MNVEEAEVDVDAAGREKSMNERLNKRPIFVNGMPRSGSSMLTHVLLSHGGLCYVEGETHQVFRGFRGDSKARRLQKLLRYLPVCVGFASDAWRCGVDVFSPHRTMAPQGYEQLPDWVFEKIDSILYESKLLARHPFQNRFKAQGVEYSDDEIKAARLVSKNLEGTVFLTELLRHMYPDSMFVTIVRNGLAVCEGHLRRRTANAAKVGRSYRLFVDLVEKHAATMSNYHVVRYEEFVRSPSQILKGLYEKADLSFDDVGSIRMVTKKVMTESGERQFVEGQKKELIWMEKSALDGYFKEDVNEAQIKRVGDEDRAEFMKEAGSAMERMGYI